MADPLAYEPVLSARASSFLVGLPKSKQRGILRLLFQLADHPTQLGDYATRDDDGREIQHLMIADWQISFWADHAVRELRITDVSRF